MIIKDIDSSEKQIEDKIEKYNEKEEIIQIEDIEDKKSKSDNNEKLNIKNNQISETEKFKN